MKITTLDDGVMIPMNDEKGISRSLVGAADGARLVDVHVNVIKASVPPAPYHVHDVAENVYIILEGTAHAIVDGVHYMLKPRDVVFIPPGVPHAAGSTPDGPVTLIEIYAPVGKDYRRVPASTPIGAPDGE
ncbi:MAG TPA: cupin domain-containing protein [Marisediminicola sp.]|nr:cupin domain-containing protein [Marisediminicola sp.]